MRDKKKSLITYILAHLISFSKVLAPSLCNVWFQTYGLKTIFFIVSPIFAPIFNQVISTKFDLTYKETNSLTCQTENNTYMEMSHVCRNCVNGCGT